MVRDIDAEIRDDQWRSEAFFVKVSDSLHAIYVPMKSNYGSLFTFASLIPFTLASVSPATKKKNLVEMRMSLDSTRRSCWDQSPPVIHRRDAALLLSSPRLKPKSGLGPYSAPIKKAEKEI
ncbi:hypothetical protein CARUB_v10010672mg [Capsella rubella]|uniref:DUF936 domain-containing protein n=1 Tax=Capsella rubella TaxID=81985 RepID=R0IDQ7_9BRAS|nr:hypothetical protein CARUB_v10010672mg [Capsella rubella]